MKKAQQETRGVQPGYLPESEVGKLKKGIGLRKRIPVSVEGDLLFTGISRRSARHMTPKALRELADLQMDLTEELVGA
jgi:hypothetical protein